MKNYLKIVIGIITIIVVLLITKEIIMAAPRIIPPLTLAKEQLWSIEQAEQQLKASYQIGMGYIRAEPLLIELIKQAWQGDKNALLQAAFIRRDTEDLDEFYSRASDDSDFSQFLQKNREQFRASDGKLLTEPEILKNTPSLVIKQLIQLGHPAASLLLYGGLISASGVRPLTAEEEKEAMQALQNSIDGGYRRQSSLANFILFQSGRFSDCDKIKGGCRLKPLTEHRQDLLAEDAQRAIRSYQLYAMHGLYVSMMRMAEAYQLGLGVEQDNLQANAWARATSYYLHLLLAKETNTQKLVSLSSALAISQHVLKVTEAQLSVAQLMQAQKKADQLLAEIDFDKGWINERDPVPPMP